MSPGDAAQRGAAEAVPETSLEQWRDLAGVLAQCTEADAAMLLRAHGSDFEVVVSCGVRAPALGAAHKDLIARCGSLAGSLEPLRDKGFLGLPLLYPDDRVFGMLCLMGEAAAGKPLASRLLAQARRLVEQDLALIQASLEPAPSLRAEQSRNIEFLEAIVDKAREAILVAQENRLVFFNPSLERMTGFGHDELMEQPFASFVHPEDKGMVLGNYSRRIAGEDAPSLYDFRVLTKDGGCIWVMNAASTFMWEGRPASLIMLTEITERKLALASLQEAERRYRELFENAPVAIFQATPQGRFTSVNPEYARIAGYDSPEHMIESISDIASQLYVDPAVRDEYKRKLAEEGSVKHFEAELKRTGGGTFWASMNTKAMRGPDGEILSYDGFLTDVSERKHMDEVLQNAHDELERLVTERTRELRKANDALTALNQQLSSFLSSASHELRTPLTSVLGFAKMIQRLFERHFEPLADGDAKLMGRAKTIEDNLEVIVLEGERLRRLINDLLDVNKIEAGRMEWRDELLDMREVLLAAGRKAAVRFQAGSETQFAMDIPDFLPPVLLDPDRILQVLDNLLDNAAKFTARGRVSLSAWAPDQTSLVIRVTDTGPGIPAGDRDRIFDKFFQTADRAEELGKPKGTGLGLAICRQIVTHYGGAIHVEPGPDGKGSSFVVTLPAA